MKKKRMNILWAGVCLLALSACEKDLPVYETEGAWLNFVYYDYNGDQVTATENVEETMCESHYSFVLQSATKGEEIQQDTFWIEVSTMGFLSDQNRTVELQQIATGENDAVPGVHYVAFNDPQLLAKSYVPAGQNATRVPIVVMRDASLADHDVTLQFTFKDNGIFKPGYEAFATHTLYISDKLAKPGLWDTYYCDYNFGTYTPAKHELMIEWTGNAWDDAYLEELFGGDSGYVTYLGQWFQRKLAEENAAREAQGLDIYREPDGSPVSFEPLSWGY